MFFVQIDNQAGSPGIIYKQIKVGDENKYCNHFINDFYHLMLVQRLTIPHFKDFDILHLKYEIRICPKNYNKITITLYFYYEIVCIRRYI